MNFPHSSNVPDYLSSFLSTHRASPVALSYADTQKALDSLFGIGEDGWNLPTIVHPDISYFAPDELDWKVEEVRTKIIARSSIAPEGPYQVIIIDRADEMTVASANALLKILEDTPKDTFFILIIRSRVALLPTIASRIRIVSLESGTSFTLTDDQKEMVRGIVRKDAKSIGKFLAVKTFDRPYAVAFLEALRKDIAENGKPVPENFYDIVSDALGSIFSTNATAKYQIDRVVLAYLGHR